MPVSHQPEAPPSAQFDPTKAVAAAKAVPKTRLADYTSYWRTIRRAMTVEGVHQRYLYACASVNNAVAGHLLCYRWFLRHPPGFSARMSEKQFVARLRRAAVGGQFAVRGGGVYRFDRDFIADPDRWAPDAPTPADRDRLADAFYGLGAAKMAFALELVDPLNCTAVCLDRHMLRLFGYSALGTPNKTTAAQYAEAEAYWLKLARARNVSPFVLRSAWWDSRFGRSDCRWWSAYFEPWFAPYAWAAGYGESRW